nr:hypothetical protein Iba_chr03bCG6170 [Ipomoea batatas]
MFFIIHTEEMLNLVKFAFLHQGHTFFQRSGRMHLLCLQVTITAHLGVQSTNSCHLLSSISCYMTGKSCLVKDVIVILFFVLEEKRTLYLF